MKIINIIATSLTLYSCISEYSLNRFSDRDIEALNIKNSAIIKESKESAARTIDLGNTVGKNVFNEEAIIESMEFIPLETTEESVFNGIKKIIMSKERVYIMDYDGQFLIFSSDGKFIKRIRKGQGPGEISKLWDFCYNETNNNVTLYQSDKLNTYDRDGNFLKEMRCPILFSEFISIGNKFVFYQPFACNYQLDSLSNNSVYITDIDMSMKGFGLCCVDYKSSDIVTANGYLHKYGSELLLSSVINDTIYKIGDNMIVPKYIIEYDSKADINSIETIRSTNKFYHIGGYLETEGGQVFKFWSPQNGLCVVFRDKKNGKIAGGTISTGAGRSLPHYCFSTNSTFNEYFISSYTPGKDNHFESMKISDESKIRVQKLSDEDNPVIILYKIKI